MQWDEALINYVPSRLESKSLRLITRLSLLLWKEFVVTRLVTKGYLHEQIV